MKTSPSRSTALAATMAVTAILGIPGIPGISGALTSAATGASQDVTYIEAFDDGMNHTDWTWDRTPLGSIEPTGGVPLSGGFFRSGDLMPVPSLFTSHSTFTGDFRARGVNSIGGDLRSVEFASQAGVITIVLVHFNGTPDDMFDSSLAHFITSIPSPTNPDMGWVSFDLEIPSDSETLPPGWVMTGALPFWEPAVDWNTLITNVDEVIISWHSSLGPVFLFDVTRGADNLRITYRDEQSSGPPIYAATVLPQLDTTDDEFSLTYTSPFAINNSKGVTGELGSGLGFVWSPMTGGTLLQPNFSEFADAALGTGINAAGDVCGRYRPTGVFTTRPFHFAADGTFTPLPTLGSNLAGGTWDLNDSGMVVGASETAPGGMFGGPTTAVYWLGGQIFQIGGLGGPDSGAFAVNNHGVVAGAANSAGAPALQPFRWTEKGGIEVLPQLVPGVPATPAGINDAGVVVGRGGISLFANEPVYWDADGAIHQLPRFEQDTADVGVLAVNNSNVMVGFALPGDTWVFEARLWLDGEVYRLQDFVPDLDADIHLRRATGVNDNGDIVVEASTEVNGTIQFITVILTPEPGEPGLLGDLNGDGAVNVQDLLILLGAWGPCGKGACPADLNESGAVDVQDLLILLANWG